MPVRWGWWCCSNDTETTFARTVLIAVVQTGVLCLEMVALPHTHTNTLTLTHANVQIGVCGFVSEQPPHHPQLVHVDVCRPYVCVCVAFFVNKLMNINQHYQPKTHSPALAHLRSSNHAQPQHKKYTRSIAISAAVHPRAVLEVVFFCFVGGGGMFSLAYILNGYLVLSTNVCMRFCFFFAVVLWYMADYTGAPMKSLSHSGEQISF